MTDILDHVSPTPVLEIDVCPRSATRRNGLLLHAE